MAALVSYRLDDSIATITMDDGKVNVLSPRMFGEINAALDRAAADRAVVVLSGRPGVFSAGFDLPLLRAGGPEAIAMVRSGFELAARVLSFPMPVVIACTGHVVAMGVFLLVSADYRIGAAGRTSTPRTKLRSASRCRSPRSRYSANDWRPRTSTAR